MLPASWQQSTGAATSASGAQVPQYAPAVQTLVRCQALSNKDLSQLDGVNINGEYQALYVNGPVEGANRADARGGDLITLTTDGSLWLVTQVLENWNRSSGWTKVAVARQMQ
jgi:hypothetical protein